jgi:glycosyltransferase involved in cell wall biosynthesis
MRLLIDLQGAQGINRNRGIGKYTINFTKELCNISKKHDVCLLINGSYNESAIELQSIFKSYVPSNNLYIWMPPKIIRNGPDDSFHESITGLCYQQFVNRIIKPEIRIITSPFEGYHDNCVTPLSSDEHSSIAIVYDMIPLLYPEIYLKDPSYRHWYKERTEQLKELDTIYTISKSAKDDIHKVLETEMPIINISCAANLVSPSKKNSLDQRDAIYKKFKIKGSYVLYTGGFDERKNIYRLLEAWSLLPTNVIDQYQLILVFYLNNDARKEIEKKIQQLNIKENQVVLTGYTEDDDLATLYSFCDFFIFPSWYEGFGMPILEAMSFGKAVLASNSSSIPELIESEEALFDPFNSQDIANKIKRLSRDTDLKNLLEASSKSTSQAFTWGKTAQLAMTYLEQNHKVFKKKKYNHKLDLYTKKILKLAYLSPLPPDKSGISDYSIDLLRHLKDHYEIDVIATHPNNILVENLDDKIGIKSIDAFKRTSNNYDRVIYHFGNSPYHEHMFELLKEIPGVVILHDFYLSDLQNASETNNWRTNALKKSLYKGHGYNSLLHKNNIQFYPANIDVLQDAVGVIVHSNFCLSLALQHYSIVDQSSIKIIPILKQANDLRIRKTDEDNKTRPFTICCFGILTQHKLNKEIIEAFIAAYTEVKSNIQLVFVGEANLQYGQCLHDIIEESGIEDRITITGWVNSSDYLRWLVNADIAIQLRTNSRGESSASVLDCLSHGLPTIINQHGSNTEIPDDVVIKLPETFCTRDLAKEIINLYENKILRKALSMKAVNYISKIHSPQICTQMYADSIESFYDLNKDNFYKGLQDFSSILKEAPISHTLEVSSLQAKIYPPSIRNKQILVDISEIIKHDAKSGIQRVIKTVLTEWLHNPPFGYKIEPVYATLAEGYRYAHSYTMKKLGLDYIVEQDRFIDLHPGDIFIALDLSPNIQCAHKNCFKEMMNLGVKVKHLVYDLIPITNPEYFPSGVSIFKEWIKLVIDSDQAICISKTVAHRMEKYIETNRIITNINFNIKWNHISSELIAEELNINQDDIAKFPEINFNNHTFLMVGTIEPRKGHDQVIEAFEELWKCNSHINLVLVGKEGWEVESVIKKIKSKSITNNIYWLDNINDIGLIYLYKNSTALIAASKDEGFGLPLIEASHFGLPIIAREIEIFREVLDENAYYFNTNNPTILSDTIVKWLKLFKKNAHPESNRVNYLNTKQFANNLINTIVDR